MAITLEEEDRGIILGAMRSMASCLANYGHPWDEGEKAAYEVATELLGGEKLEWRDMPADDADKWKTGG